MINKDNNEEIQNKRLMSAMWTLLITNSLFYIEILLLAINTLEDGMLLGIIICISTILFVISGFYALKLEVEAGYYECNNCHHKFVPKYKEAILAPHIGTIRYLKCPKCNKRTWSKKVMTK